MRADNIEAWELTDSANAYIEENIKWTFSEAGMWVLLKTFYCAKESSGIEVNQALKIAFPGIDFYASRKVRDRAHPLVTALLQQYEEKYPSSIYRYDYGERDEGWSDDPYQPAKSTRPKYKVVMLEETENPEATYFLYALVSTHLRFFLNPAQREFIDGRLISNRGNRIKVDEWVRHIASKPRYPGIYPKYPADVQEYNEVVVNRGLTVGKGFYAKYDSDDKFDVFYPIKIIRREHVSYAVCARRKESDRSPREYAIHRLTMVMATSPWEVELLEWEGASQLTTLDENSETAHIQGGWGELATLTLIITNDKNNCGPAQHFRYVQFHEDPKDADLTISEPLADNPASTKLTIRNIRYTYELKTWLLGLGKYLEFIDAEPIKKGSNIDVKADLARDIKAMAKTVGQ